MDHLLGKTYAFQPAHLGVPYLLLPNQPLTILYRQSDIFTSEFRANVLPNSKTSRAPKVSVRREGPAYCGHGLQEKWNTKIYSPACPPPKQRILHQHGANHAYYRGNIRSVPKANPGHGLNPRDSRFSQTRRHGLSHTAGYRILKSSNPRTVRNDLTRKETPGAKKIITSEQLV